MKSFVLLLLISQVFPVYAHSNHEHAVTNKQSYDVVIHDPWVRSAPVNAPMLGVFMQIQNNTNHELKLLSAKAKGFQRVELHRTTNHNGMMKMKKQQYMPILAQSRLHLKPGSWHIMLIGPESVPSEGKIVMIELEFDNSIVHTAYAVVKKGKIMMNHNSMDR